jgi:hypothetical protein
MALVNALDSSIGKLLILSQAKVFVRINDINQVVGDKGEFLLAGFSRANIHITVNLSAVSTYYLPIKRLSQAKSQLALAHAGGTNNSQ